MSRASAARRAHRAAYPDKHKPVTAKPPPKGPPITDERMAEIMGMEVGDEEVIRMRKVLGPGATAARVREVLRLVGIASRYA